MTSNSMPRSQYTTFPFIVAKLFFVPIPKEALAPTVGIRFPTKHVEITENKKRIATRFALAMTNKTNDIYPTKTVNIVFSLILLD